MRSRRAWRPLALLALALGCGSEPRGACQSDPPAGELGSVCGFANPEDVAWVPSAQLLLVSEMRHAGSPAGGALAALSLGAAGEPIAPARQLWPPAHGAASRAAAPAAFAGDPACTQPPQPASFSPHGIASTAPAADGAVAVAAVGHGEREAIELFRLRGVGEAASLEWTGCVPLPPDAIGNDVWLDASGGIWTTNYQPAMTGLSGLYYTIAGGLGRPTGEVLHWQIGVSDPGWESVAGTRGPNPNGIVLAPGDAMLAVAFTGSGRVAIRPFTSAGGSVRDVDVGGHPDNLLWTSRATLLVPVHTSGLAFLRCRFGALPCASPWKLMEIDPLSGAARERYAHDGSRVGAVASVAEVGQRLYFGSVFDDRIGLLIER